ncbi:unnamed protein product [Amoebophrya sp. A120]|nr:unnamed protein product [Amoebophrya sp. A120]|eukprot:GSA120T00003998001.1
MSRLSGAPLLRFSLVAGSFQLLLLRSLIFGSLVSTGVDLVFADPGLKFLNMAASMKNATTVSAGDLEVSARATFLQAMTGSTQAERQQAWTELDTAFIGTQHANTANELFHLLEVLQVHDLLDSSYDNDDEDGEEPVDHGDGEDRLRNDGSSSQLQEDENDNNTGVDEDDSNEHAPTGARPDRFATARSLLADAALVALDERQKSNRLVKFLKKTFRGPLLWSEVVPHLTFYKVKSASKGREDDQDAGATLLEAVTRFLDYHKVVPFHLQGLDDAKYQQKYPLSHLMQVDYVPVYEERARNLAQVTAARLQWEAKAISAEVAIFLGQTMQNAEDLVFAEKLRLDSPDEEKTSSSVARRAEKKGKQAVECKRTAATAEHRFLPRLRQLLVTVGQVLNQMQASHGGPVKARHVLKSMVNGKPVEEQDFGIQLHETSTDVQLKSVSALKEIAEQTGGVHTEKTVSTLEEAQAMTKTMGVFSSQLKLKLAAALWNVRAKARQTKKEIGTAGPQKTKKGFRFFGRLFQGQEGRH